MKVYVDELPKNCVNCDFGYSNNFCELDYELDLRKFDKNQKHPKCPLSLLADYTKQVRKEVCEEIKDLAGDYFELHCCEECGTIDDSDVVLKGKDLTELLDQIDKGE